MNESEATFTVIPADGESFPIAILPTAVYTIQETARLLRTDRARIYGYLADGTLRAFKLGVNDRRRLVYGESIIQLIKSLVKKGA